MLAALYNRERAHLKAISQEYSDSSSCVKEAHQIAFSELLIYITGTKKCNEDSSTMFRLADLTKMYKEGLEQLGVESSKAVDGQVH